MNDLKLENQLCFPLYAASKELIKKYKPVLDKFDLTYTQYLVMLVLWEDNSINVKTLGERLMLDSGTLTPLLKKMESKGYVKREVNDKDERNLVISLTEVGKNLKGKCSSVPKEVGKCLNLNENEAIILYSLLYKVIGNIKDTSM